MNSSLSNQQEAILRVFDELAPQRASNELSVAEIAEVLYPNDPDPAARFASVQQDLMILAEKGLIEHYRHLHEWGLVQKHQEPGS